MSAVWEPDPELLLGNLDPVSAWIGGWGRDFYRSLPDTAGTETDFRYAAVIDASNPISAILRPDGRDGDVAVLLQSDQGAALKEAGASQYSEKIGMTDPRVLLLPLPDEAVPPEAQTRTDRLVEFPQAAAPAPQSLGVAPKAVIGIIDHAIQFGNSRFRARSGTRVLHAWAQDAAVGAVPTTPFGREWTAQDLDALHLEAKGNDEAMLRAMGLLDFTKAAPRPLAMAQTHGTHVLDLAGGYDPQDNRTDLPILAVNLPAIVARESSGAFLGLFFLLGFEFLLSRCRSLGDRVPLYVNFSFGLSGGPRGGEHLIERGMNALVKQHRSEGGGEVLVTLPAGNRNLARGHAAPARRIARNRAGFDLTWRMPPGDPSSNALDLWLRRRTGDAPLADSVTLKLTPPDAEKPLHAQDLKAPAATLDLQQRAAGEIPHSVLLRPAPGAAPIGRATLRRDIPTGALSLSVMLAPTDPRGSGRAPTPPGDWRLSVESHDSAPDDVDLQAWVLRDDTLPGFRDGRRQSTFVDPAYRERSREGFARPKDDGPATIRRAGTLNAIATGTVPPELRGFHSRVVVGGAIEHAGLFAAPEPTPYSSNPLPPSEGWGDDERIDCRAATDRSPFRPGVLGANTRSGSRAALNGTSVAAPQVLRYMIEHAIGVPDVPAMIGALPDSEGKLFPPGD